MQYFLMTQMINSLLLVKDMQIGFVLVNLAKENVLEIIFVDELYGIFFLE